VALQILNAGPDPSEVANDLRGRIEAAIEEASVHVEAAGPGHYEIRVVSPAFAGLSRVRQQQLVYAAIAELMSGREAPVHAIDKMECVTP